MDPFNERLRKIEHRLTAIEGQLNLHPPSLPVDSPKQSPPLVLFKPSVQRDDPSSLIGWLKDNWLVSIGIFLIILAMGWFISYAFANDWIGETMRVFLGVIVGAILGSTGIWLLRKQPRGGQALIILGEAIAIIAFFAGHQFYFILSTFHTFLLMLVVVNLTAIIAIKNHLESLGLSSIIFAAIIPMLIDADSSNSIFLLGYVLIIDAAALWVWTKRGWGNIFQIAWLATLTYSFSSFSLMTIDEPLIANFFVWAFYLIFFLPIAFSIHRKKLPLLPLKGTFILLSLTLAFLFWIDYSTQFPWSAISYLTASLLWTALGYSMAKNWDDIEPKDSTIKYVLGIIMGFSVMTLLLMATYKLTHHFFLYPVSFDAKIIFYFIEITAAISLGYFILQSPLVSIYLSLFFIIPLSNLWGSDVSILYAPFLSLKFAILWIAMISLFSAARINQKVLLHVEASPFQKLILNVLWIIASLFAMILVWNICHQLFPTDNIARGVALIVYTIAAQTLIYMGNLKQLKNLRLGGFALILFVFLRLIGEEIWAMPIVLRTITFSVIGLLLIGNAFFDKQYKKT